MAGRGGSSREEFGRRRGGRGAPGRGEGRFGTPPPPPLGGIGRGGRGDFSGRDAGPAARGRGGSPYPGGGRGRGGRRSFTPSPQLRQQQQRYSPASSYGRGYSGGGTSPQGVNAGFGAASGKLFGRGAEAVSFDRDKEKGLWKVGPPDGQRFSAAWLRGLSAFVAWKYQQQAQQGQPLAAPASPPPPAPPLQQQPQPHHMTARPPPVTAEHLPSSPPLGRPPVSVERLERAGSLAEQDMDAAGSRAGAAGSPEAGDEAVFAVAACSPGGGLASRASSSASSCSSDLGWAGVLADAAAAESSAGGGSSLAAENSGGSVTGAGSAPGSGSIGSPASSGEPASPSGCRTWWPVSEAALQSPELVAVVQQTEPALLPGAAPPVQLSIRLERMSLTDREAQMLAEWCCQEACGTASVRKLWLFDNRLGDEGAVQVARILEKHPGMVEVHLSHNLMTLQGAAVLLEALAVPIAAAAEPAAGSNTSSCSAEPEDAGVEALGSEAAAGEGASAAGFGSNGGAPPPGSRRPLWLRLEWNRISLEGLVQVLEELHMRRGLVVDVPTAIRPDATPSLPDLPPYLQSAAVATPAGAAAVPASRGSRNALQFLVQACHARLPWVSCQYQLPSEAAVLKAARRGWSQQRLQQAQPAADAAPAASSSSQSTAESVASPLQPPPPPAMPATPAGSGPLLLFPDTSALLPMLGAGANVSIPTFLTLDLLGQLAQQGRFGRSLPAHEQVFLVVTDSVLKQLDGLKNDGAVRPAIRRFLGQGLDAYGPAGADFLTVLGSHEGEGLVVEHDAAVAGSRSVDVGTKGQRADHRIVEVALFFQREVCGSGSSSSSAIDEVSSTNGSGGEGASSAANRPLTAASFPVLLLSGDNAQVQTARSHGLPAARMVDVAAVQGRLQAAFERRQPLTASLLRSCLGAAAVAGLAERAAVRSLQSEFDDVVAALEAATAALAASQQQLEAVSAVAAAGGVGDAEPAMAAVQRALASPVVDGGLQQLVPALQARLADWQGLVRSHQDPSRLRRWASNSGGG